MRIHSPISTSFPQAPGIHYKVRASVPKADSTAWLPEGSNSKPESLRSLIPAHHVFLSPSVSVSHSIFFSHLPPFFCFYCVSMLVTSAVTTRLLHFVPQFHGPGEAVWNHHLTNLGRGSTLVQPALPSPSLWVNETDS